jgi:hypothetical protein
MLLLRFVGHCDFRDAQKTKGRHFYLHFAFLSRDLLRIALNTSCSNAATFLGTALVDVSPLVDAHGKKTREIRFGQFRQGLV